MNIFFSSDFGDECRISNDIIFIVYMCADDGSVWSWGYNSCILKQMPLIF